MKSKLKQFGLFIIIITTLTCKKEAEVEPSEYPFFLLTEINDISQSGVTFNSHITNLGKQKILSYGFVWEEENQSSYFPEECIPALNDNYISLGDNPIKGDFSYRVSTDLYNNSTYYVRAYILTDKGVVYSNTLSFLSKGCLPPRIHDVYPKSGTIGKIITIVGENFSNFPENNRVYFGEKRGTVVKCNADTLLVQCPYNTSHFIEVEVADKNAYYDKFYLLDPWFQYSGFSHYYNSDFYRVESVSCVLDSFGYTSLGKIYDYTSVFSPRNLWQFSLKTRQWAKLKDFPATVRSYATSFSANGLVYFGLGAKDSTGYSDLWSYNPISDEWKAKSKFPGGKFKMNNFVINDTVYLYSRLDSENEFWIYYSLSDTWQKQNTTQVPNVAFCCTYNNIGYLVTRRGSIWQYNPKSMIFDYIGDLNGEYVEVAEGFCINGVIYAMRDENFDGVYGNFYFDLNNKYWNVMYYPTYGPLDILFTFKDRAYISSVYDNYLWELYPR